MPKVQYLTGILSLSVRLETTKSEKIKMEFILLLFKERVYEAKKKERGGLVPFTPGFEFLFFSSASSSSSSSSSSLTRL